MERLTDARLAFPPDVWIEATRETREILSTIPVPTLRELYYRLALIEDILGDGYDLDRLRELMMADREGRCVVLPIKIPGWGWYCNDKFPNAISAYFDYPSQVVGCMEDYILRGTKEEAEAALEHKK